MSFPRLDSIKVRIDKEWNEKCIIVLPYIIKIILSHSTADHQELANYLINFPAKILLALCQRNPALENFCRTNPIVTEQFAKKLIASDQMNMAIHSMDTKMNLSIFDLYLAASFMTLFQSRQEDRIKCLDSACILGSNDALLVRCATNEKTMLIHPEKQQATLDSILHDAHILSNLYWGLGYIQSAFYLHSIGTLLKTKMNPTLGQQWIEIAVKNFLCACYLKDHTYSNEIINNFTQGKGIDYIFKNKNIKMVDWEDAHSLFREWVGTRYAQLQLEAEREVNNIVMIQHKKL